MMSATRLIFVFLFTSVFLMGAPTWVDSTPGDPCAFFNDLKLGEESNEPLETRIKKIINTVIRLGMKPTISEFKEGMPPYFTIGSGFGYSVVCDPDQQERKLERTYYFPIGMVVYPQGYWTFNGRQYYYVLTEHGHNIFIDALRLRSFEEDLIYIFHRGPKPISYCYGINCPDKQTQILIANSSFATTPKTEQMMDLIKNKQCEEIPITTYYKQILRSEGGKEEVRYGVPTGLHNARLHTCQSGQFNNDLRYFTKLGAMHMQVSSQPIKGIYNKSYQKKLTTISPQFVWAKVCQKSIKISKAFSLSGSLGAKLDFLNIGAKAEAEMKTEEETYYAPGKYILFSSYIVSGLIADKPSAFDIISVCDCKDKTNPMEFEAVNIYFGENPTDMIPINEAHIRTELENLGFPTHFKWQIRKDAALMEGRHWIISGYEQYFFWVDFWKKQLDQFFILKNLYSRHLDNSREQITEEEKKKLLSFYAHLIISATFDFYNQEQAKDYRENGIVIE